MEDKSAEMPPPYESSMPLQNYPYAPPGNQQYPPQAPMQQQPPMHASQMQYAPSNGNPQYPGPPPQNPPYAAQQPDMQKPVYLPTSAAYPPTSTGYAPLHQQGYGYPGHMSQQTTNTTAVVAVGQIPAAQQQITHEIPPNYAAFAWFVFLCCCFPIGIAAIRSSSRVDHAVANGNFIEARRQSCRAKGYGIAGVVGGVIMIVLVIIRYAVLDP